MVCGNLLIGMLILLEHMIVITKYFLLYVLLVLFTRTILRYFMQGRERKGSGWGGGRRKGVFPKFNTTLQTGWVGFPSFLIQT